MIADHASLFGWLPLIGVAIFAWWKGDWPERWGGLINLAAAGGAFAIRLTLKDTPQDVALLVVDAVLAFGFLALALVFASWWLGGAMLFQAAQFALHAYYLVQERHPDMLNYVFNNINTTGVEVCIVVGVIGSWVHRVRERKREEAAAAT